MHYKINTMSGSIPLGSYGSFDLSEGSTAYIQGLGDKFIPGFIMDIFGDRPAPATTPQIDPKILYAVGGGAAFLLIVLMMKKKPRNGNGYRRAPAKRTYRKKR